MLSAIMKQAIETARKGMDTGNTPFGAVIATKAGQTIFKAHNTVISSTDATAHAEVNAIRGACRILATIDLSGHIMAATCEPCPMCAAAIHWAGLEAVVFGASIADALDAGFNELRLPCASLYKRGGSKVAVHAGVLQEECRNLFTEWTSRPDSRAY